LWSASDKEMLSRVVAIRKRMFNQPLELFWNNDLSLSVSFSIFLCLYLPYRFCVLPFECPLQVGQK
jgi:hypothetical protein